MTNLVRAPAARKASRRPDATVPAPTGTMLRLLARLARGAIPLADLRGAADREALSLAMRRREVLLSAAGGIAFVVRRPPPA